MLVINVERKIGSVHRRRMLAWRRRAMGFDGFGSATREDAESADVEPFPADATHAAEFDNLASGLRHGSLRD